MNFAQRLEELMQSNGITKYRISKAVGCSASTVTNWLNGTAPTGDYLQKLSDFFEVSVDYLLGNEEKPAAEDDNELNEMLEDIRRNPELRAMFSITRKATPEQVRQYTDVIKAIKGEK